MKIMCLVFSLVLFAGCISEPQIEQTTKVDLGNIYDITPEKLDMKIDANVTITITNKWDNEIRIRILDASLTANYKDGSKKDTKGIYQGYEIIPAGSSASFSISFTQIPVAYRLTAEPL